MGKRDSGRRSYYSDLSAFDNPVYLSGLSGLVSMPTCGGNTCSSCPGCWGMRIGMVILVIIKRVGGKK